MFGKDWRRAAAALAFAVLLGGPAVAQTAHDHHAHGQDHGQAQEPQGDGHDAHAGHDSHAEHEETAPETHESASVEPGQPAKTLSPDELDAPADTSVEDARRAEEMAEAMSGEGSHEGHGGHGGHGTGAYRHVDAGREAGAENAAGEHDHPGHDAHQHEGEQETAAAYVCPMHPEVTSATPAKCPKCGMALVERRKE